MKYVSPKYELEVLETEDIMGLSILMGNGIWGEATEGGADSDSTTNDVSVSVGVGDLLP